MYVTDYDNIAFIWLQNVWPLWNKCLRCSLFYTVHTNNFYIPLYYCTFPGKDQKKCRITLVFMCCFAVFRRNWIKTGQEFRSMWIKKTALFANLRYIFLDSYCRNSSVVRCYGDKNKRENTLLKHSMNEIYSLHRITITIWLLEKR